ncbi:unnamed protein product [Macrosiphum euphorbiae]|uniref:Uncharacterized protein n=1 Tax=Macrosiphum euphorbiae TaxID=13131 RepID=A0AAV0XF59_9HEMI|nr:unnamed protein product [Macrosiphum euphorbiae]
MSGDQRGGGFYATVRVISTAAKNGGYDDSGRWRDGDVTADAVVASGDKPVILTSRAGPVRDRQNLTWALGTSYDGDRVKSTRRRAAGNTR